MKRILAYGDSNTWGYISGTLDRQTLYCDRFPTDIRWTGVLQKTIGNDYMIIEEGLPGRTITTTDPVMPEVNGMHYLYPCLLSQRPLDLVILMLGTNDLKSAYKLDATSITAHIHTMCSLIEKTLTGPHNKLPTILLVAPPIIKTALLSNDMYPYYADAQAISEKLATQYAMLAKQKDYLFCDASGLTSFTTSDGLHLDKEGHRQLAIMLANEIQKITM